jgi:ankyrin repeat protein
VLLAHGANLTHADTRRVASLIAPNYNPTFPKDKLLAILQNDDISWVNADYADFSNKNHNEQNALSALASWGVIVGNQSFVTDMISLRQDTLSLAEHTEYLRLALQAQRLEVAETLLQHLHEKHGQNNKQTVCNYLLHLMVIEHGPLPAVELLLQHGAVPKQYTPAHCEERDRSLLEKHTLFQEQKMADNKSPLPSKKIYEQTLFHVASARGNHAVLKKIIEYSRPPTCSASPCA